MKNKTLVMVSAAIITTAAIGLTAGLSLLHSSAIENEPTPAEASVPVSNVGESDVLKTENEKVQVTDKNQGQMDNESLLEHNGQFVDDPGNYGLPIEEVIYSKDIIIDIYEHSTGKLVGRVTVLDDDVYAAGEKLFDEVFDWTQECFDVNDPNATPVTLPQGKYRVEVYSLKRAVSYGGESVGINSLFSMAYTYGSEENIWEFNQIGLPFYGCEAYVDFIDNLIADEIAAIEAGTASPISGQSMAQFARWDDEDGYWEKVDRYTERFPYLAD